MSSKVTRKATKLKASMPAPRVGSTARGKRAARTLEPVDRQASLPLAPASKPAAKKGGVKPISPKLLEAIERRRRAAEENEEMPKPVGRRGRRPKAGFTDYQPDEEGFNAEPEVSESLEYDVGIKVARKEDEFGALDRSEDFEEELNFDW